MPRECECEGEERIGTFKGGGGRCGGGGGSGSGSDRWWELERNANGKRATQGQQRGTVGWAIEPNQTGFRKVVRQRQVPRNRGRQGAQPKKNARQKKRQNRLKNTEAEGEERQASSKCKGEQGTEKNTVVVAVIVVVYGAVSGTVTSYSQSAVYRQLLQLRIAAAATTTITLLVCRNV